MGRHLKMDPELEEVVSLYKTACCLKQLPRQGWIQEGALVTEADCVAGHSFCVALTAFMLAQVLKNRGHDVNVDRVLAMAVFHDLPECATGEIASAVKNCMGADADRIEEELFAKLLNGLGVKRGSPGVGESVQRWRDKRSSDSQICRYS